MFQGRHFFLSFHVIFFFLIFFTTSRIFSSNFPVPGGGRGLGLSVWGLFMWGLSTRGLFTGVCPPGVRGLALSVRAGSVGPAGRCRVSGVSQPRGPCPLSGPQRRPGRVWGLGLLPSQPSEPSEPRWEGA